MARTKGQRLCRAPRRSLAGVSWNLCHSVSVEDATSFWQRIKEQFGALDFCLFLEGGDVGSKTNPEAAGFRTFEDGLIMGNCVAVCEELCSCV
eukprot:2184923-Lingulodinium_polyedra.AAC.1